MNEQMLEILISKYIDSEITPAEQKMLDAEMQRNPEARETLKVLEQLREQAQQMLKEEVVLSGAPAKTIIERALAQADRPRKQNATAYRPWYRDPISLAACFILGLGFVSFWVHYGNPVNPSPPRGNHAANSVQRPQKREIESPDRRPPIPDGIYVYVTHPETGKVIAVELFPNQDVKAVRYDEGL